MLMSDRPEKEILSLQEVTLRATVGFDYLLQDISLQLTVGSKVGVIGASGAGKTSLLKLLNRLVSPSQGQINFGNFIKQPEISSQLRRQIALVPQEPKLLGMKVVDALSYPLTLQQLSESEIRQRLDIWCDLVSIPSEWFNKTELQLSLGQRQLVAIARALMMQPQVLLLDEPTSALDLGTASRLLEVLESLNANQNLTIVMVNHQWDLIKNFCDRLWFLEKGKLAADIPANPSNWEQLQQKLWQSQTQEQEEWD